MKEAPKPRVMRDVFLSALYDRMAQDDKLMVLAADFGSPVLDRIRSDYPGCFLNVGIAEQNLINVSTGMALEGHTVIAYAIAPFITMRCYEQIRVNLGILAQIRPLNVILVGVGAGCSYSVSGPTHQCFEDLSIMRVIPGLRFFSPCDAGSVARLLPRLIDDPGVKYVRMDAKPVTDVLSNHENDMVSGFSVLNRGAGPTIVSTGIMTHVAMDACSQLLNAGKITPTVVDIYRLSPMPDLAALGSVLAGTSVLITLEEGFVGAGGLDALMWQFMARAGLKIPEVRNVGWSGGYCFDPGKREELLKLHGLDVDSVMEVVSQCEK